MIYYVLVLFCQKTAEIYIPLSLNCKYMMNQNSSGFLSSIPMVTKNLIIINLLFWVASLVLPKVGIDLVQLFGLHFPGVKDFYPFQFVTYMFMHDTHSFAHVFFNMFGVYMFGRVLENVWGPKRFLIFYGLAELFMGVANNGGDSVAHFAHLGGMLFGYFLVRYWKKKDIDNGRYFY